MAEGFARAHGADVLVAQSAGLAPAISVSPLTHKVMLEKNIDLGDSYPKAVDQVIEGAELIVNMSGHELRLKTKAVVEEWDLRDPIGESEEVYREVRDQIEQHVLQLIDTMRSRKPPASASAPNGARVDTRRHPTRQ
jgi:arsenate reductase (thioredoxin)